MVGATGGTASFSVPIAATQAPEQPADEPVPFTVTVELPSEVAASEATCEIDGATCQADVAGNTVTATGAVPAGELAQQPQVTIDVIVPDAAAAPAQPVAATACTVVGQTGSQPAGICTGTQTEVSVSVAPGVSPTTASGVVVLPGTGTGDDDGNLAILFGGLLAVVATAMAIVAIRMRRT